MAYVAKMRCQNPPADDLSLDESASIMLYTMDWEPQDECLYFVLNANLRSENRKKLVPWFCFFEITLDCIFSTSSIRSFCCLSWNKTRHEREI